MGTQASGIARKVDGTAELTCDLLLAELRRDILALDGVSGLALDLTSKPPGTIEWE